MRMHQQFCTLVVLVSLMNAGSVMRAAGQTSLSVDPGQTWVTTGYASTGGSYTNFLTTPSVNPQTLNPPTSVVFGNLITNGTGSDTFNTSVTLDFSVTTPVTTNSFVAAGTIAGPISDASSTASLTFSSLTDTTSGQTDTVHTFTDPSSSQQALLLNTDVGAIYVDYTAPIPTSTQNPYPLGGYVGLPLITNPPSVPEPGSIALLMSLGGGLLYLRAAVRHRQ